MSIPTRFAKTTEAPAEQKGQCRSAIKSGLTEVVRQPDNDASNESPRRRFAAGACVEPIVECIQKMRAQGLANGEIAALFRHAADELDESKGNPGHK